LSIIAGARGYKFSLEEKIEWRLLLEEESARSKVAVGKCWIIGISWQVVPGWLRLNSG